MPTQIRNGRPFCVEQQECIRKVSSPRHTRVPSSVLLTLKRIFAHHISKWLLNVLQNISTEKRVCNRLSWMQCLTDIFFLPKNYIIHKTIPHQFVLSSRSNYKLRGCLEGKFLLSWYEDLSKRLCAWACNPSIREGHGTFQELRGHTCGTAKMVSPSLLRYLPQKNREL